MLWLIPSLILGPVFVAGGYELALRRKLPFVSGILTTIGLVGGSFATLLTPNAKLVLYSFLGIIVLELMLQTNFWVMRYMRNDFCLSQKSSWGLVSRK